MSPNSPKNELAERLGVGQAAASKVERQEDLLLSTLASYVSAAGSHARLVITVNGQNIEFDPDSFAK